MALLASMGCSKASPNATDAAVKPQDLLVAAASDLVSAMPELARQFEAQNPGAKVVPSFGPSGSFVQQIVNGAPFDVFLSADRRFVQQLLESKNLDGESRRVYAFGRLVLYVPGMRISDLSELRLNTVKRIAIANPEIAPYGRAAKQVLERAHLWAELEPKIVIAENIRQALEMADTGNVEAAITAGSLVTGPSTAGNGHLPETKIDIAQDLYDPIQQEGAVVLRSGGSAYAHKFLDFLGSAAGRAVLQKYGFTFPN